MPIVHTGDEQARLQALRELSIVGTERLPEFDALVQAAATVFDCPIALVSLIEEKEQWFKACHGLDIDGTERGISFCQHAILSETVFVVPDALADDRFRDNPLVTGEPHIRFYAGCPLSIDGHHRLGTLCVIGRTPRVPTETQLEQLRRLATAVEGLIKSHKHRLEAEEATKLAEHHKDIATREFDLLEEITSVTQVGGWELDVATNTLSWTQKTYEIHEVSKDYQPTVEEALAFYAPESRPIITQAVKAGIREGKEWNLELPFITAKGRSIWVRAWGRPIFQNGKLTRLIGAFRDVTERRNHLHQIRLSEAVHKTTLDALTEGLLLLDKTGKIQSANPAAAELLGYSHGELDGQDIQELDLDIRFELEGKTRTDNPLRLAVEQADKVKGLVIRISRHGQQAVHWLKLSAVEIDAENEFNLGGVVVSLTDITETKRQADALQVIFDNFPGGVVHYDENLNLSSCNEEYTRLLEYPADLGAKGIGLIDVLTINAERGDYGPGDPEQLAKERLQMIGGGSAHTYERTRPNGTVLEVRGTPLPEGGVVASFVDITERKETERQLVANEKLARERFDELEAVLANMSQGVSVFDRHGCLKHWNRQYVDIFGKPDDEVRTGISLLELIEAEKRRDEFDGSPKEHVADLEQRLKAGEIVRSTFRHASGKIISTIHAPLPDGGWIGTHEDVTVREQAAEKIAYAAHHDTLTGLANRTLFNSELENALRTAEKSRSTSLLMLLDLDRFKPVNDTYGHDVGDELLKQFCQRLRACVRSSDLVARLGGDEFGILLPGLENGDERASSIADRIVERVRTPFVCLGNTVQVGVSIGIAQIQPNDCDISPIMKKADLALYDVKKNGRNGYRFHDDMKAMQKRSA